MKKSVELEVKFVFTPNYEGALELFSDIKNAEKGKIAEIFQKYKKLLRIESISYSPEIEEYLCKISRVERTNDPQRVMSVFFDPSDAHIQLAEFVYGLIKQAGWKSNEVRIVDTEGHIEYLSKTRIKPPEGTKKPADFEIVFIKTGSSGCLMRYFNNEYNNFISGELFDWRGKSIPNDEDIIEIANNPKWLFSYCKKPLFIIPIN